MPIIKSIEGIAPVMGENCFLAENTTIVGKVITGNNCSLWYNAVVRGDVNNIVLGNYVNVQDNAVIHCTYETSETIIGNYVNIGHNAVVHGCTIGNHVLIGMGAIVMDHAIIGDNSIIAAGAVVLSGTVVEPGAIYAGIPAKKVKQLSPQEVMEKNKEVAERYVMYASWQ